MARNQNGLAISIKAFIPMRANDLNQNLEVLTLAKTAHETGDYAALIAAASIDEVKVEQKSRRVEDAPETPAAAEPGPLLAAMEEPTPAPEEAPAAFSSRRQGISTGEDRGEAADASAA